MARPSPESPPSLPTVGHVQEFERRIRDCEVCGLHTSRNRAVPGVGPVDARLILVGIAPRRQEDLQGVPFAGGARNVLDNALADAGIDRDQVRITSLVRCRPPDDRSPSTSEVRACSAHLATELDLVGPEVIVAFGAFVTAVLYGQPVSIERVAGYRLTVRQGVTLIPTYHPADAVRGVPQAAVALRRDLTAAQAVLDGRLRTGMQVLEDLRSTTAVGS